MFVFTKLVWIVFQPLTLAFLFLLIGFALALSGWRRSGLGASFAALLILFIAMFTSTGPLLIQNLDERFPRPSGDPASLQCMIVLGGAFDTDVTTFRGGYDVNGAGDRFIEALRLAEKYPTSKILVSGGDGSLDGHYEGDAVIAERFFSAFGVDRNRLIEDKTSRNTIENASNTKELLEKNGLSHCLLITSGFHMPRSVGIFRKQGIDIVPWVVDYRSTGHERLRLDFTQPSLNTHQLSTAVREWMGLIGYYALGRTSALYPKP